MLLTSFKRVLVTVLIVTHIELLSQECSKPLQVIEKLNGEHIEPRPLNDSLSAHIFSELFFQIDPFQWVFSQRDILHFDPYRFSLDEEINSKSCRFQGELYRHYVERLVIARKRTDSILNIPMKFSDREYWKPSRGMEEIFPDDEKMLVQKIRTDLKKEVLAMALELMPTDTVKILEVDLKILIVQAQARVRKKILETLDDFNTVASNEEVFQRQYLATIAHVFDPHSEYFEAYSLKRFEEALSPERMSFGIQLKEDALGAVRIERLVPGGPAWRSGQLHHDDRLTEITLNNASVDLSDKDKREVEAVLNDVAGKDVRITVVKASGEKVTVNLLKEKIENTDNSISGFILKGGQSVGYIQLPGFFSDDDQDSGIDGCANVVAKEIVKLNKQGIDGLILDLRNNGGGSLKEAVELAGIFIDAGPVAIYEKKGEPPITLKDANRGMAYSGPLLILVNGLSASASEVVAAALQDYNRAVIVGSTTFGKATGQVVAPLQQNRPEEFLKITVSRLFRLNRLSLQHVGVHPDIELPELGERLLPTERSYRHSLQNRSVEKKVYFTPGPPFRFDSWREKSKARLVTMENFKAIISVNERLLKPFPLQENEYLDYVNYRNTQTQMIASYLKSNFVAAPAEELSSLETYRQTPESLLKEIQSSPYVQEAFNIMCDIIQSKK